MRRFNSTLLIVLSILMTTLRLKAQKQGEGSITGNILENGSLKPIQGATIALIPLTGPSTGQSMATIATLNVADPFIQQEYTSHNTRTKLQRRCLVRLPYPQLPTNPQLRLEQDHRKRTKTIIKSGS